MKRQKLQGHEPEVPDDDSEQDSPDAEMLDGDNSSDDGVSASRGENFRRNLFFSSSPAFKQNKRFHLSLESIKFVFKVGRNEAW